MKLNHAKVIVADVGESDERREEAQAVIDGAEVEEVEDEETVAEKLDGAEDEEVEDNE